MKLYYESPDGQIEICYDDTEVYSLKIYSKYFDDMIDISRVELSARLDSRLTSLVQRLRETYEEDVSEAQAGMDLERYISHL